jgi:hypothetical protein
MKKAYGLLILLIAFSLLDGTPIHNYHGKFISSRPESSVHESFNIPCSSSAFEQNDISDDSNDSENLVLFLADTGIYYRPGHTNLSDPINRGVEWLFMPIPLYKLGCDFRI